MERRTVGDRVKVAIKRREEWAVGAAEALDGKLGCVDEVQSCHRMTQIPLPTPRYLVLFDEPAASWWSGQTPPRAFWFDADDLEAVPGFAPMPVPPGFPPRAGDPVEVDQVWAAQGRGLEPLRRWFGGYVFVRAEGDQAIVAATDGVLAGVEVRYPAHSVRPA
jgi:hypothetical protein